MKRPSFQFYGGDWLRDPALGMCAPASRGVWIDLICAMYERGSGTIRASPCALARLARCSETECVEALRDLSRSGAAVVVFGDDEASVTCRRVSREFAQRVAAAQRQRRSRVAARIDGVDVRSLPTHLRNFVREVGDDGLRNLVDEWIAAHPDARDTGAALRANPLRVWFLSDEYKRRATCRHSQNQGVGNV